LPLGDLERVRSLEEDALSGGNDSSSDTCETDSCHPVCCTDVPVGPQCGCGPTGTD